MLISNFNLYKTEWLDLVFDKRNKEYGAYNIRQHYAENLSLALLIAVVVVVSGAVAIGKAIVVEPPTEKWTHVEVEPPVLPPTKKEDPVKPKVEKPVQAAEPVKTRAFLPPVVTAEVPEDEMPTIDELEKVVVGSTNIDGPETGQQNATVETPSTSGGEGLDITEDKTYTTGELSVLPTPVGGEAAWTKFLTKNLRYPEQAVDAEKSGKVWISFIIEKDGTLTDIKVMRGPGYGMDEEALRVLRKAPAWTPGIQRGKPVRVAYTLPINFSLGN